MVSLGVRVAIAFAAAVAAGGIAGRAQIVAGGLGGDHMIVWSAAHVVLDGGDPYTLLRESEHGPLRTNFNYPLPAIGFALPFVWLPVTVAATAFAAVSAGLAALALTRESLARVPIFLSMSFIYCAQFAQTTLLMLAIAITPVAAGLIVLKPNIGLALFAWRPSWRTMLVGALLLAGSVAASPTWPSEWLATISKSTDHASALRYPTGALIPLALLRWRRPEARLLLLMGTIPHGIVFYDELLLWLVALTTREALALTAFSWIAWIGWMMSSGGPTGMPALADAAIWIVPLVYLPCLIMVLRRPNEGDNLPQWIERRISGWPYWIRGATANSSRPRSDRDPAAASDGSTAALNDSM